MNKPSIIVYPKAINHIAVSVTLNDPGRSQNKK